MQTMKEKLQKANARIAELETNQTSEITINEDYFDEPYSNNVVRNGNVCRVDLTVKVTTDIPNNATFAYLPYKSYKGGNDMLGLGSVYATTSVAWFYWTGGNTYLRSRRNKLWTIYTFELYLHL